jgi:peptidylprolyl isomerase
MKKALQLMAIFAFVLGVTFTTAKAQNMDDILYIDLEYGQVAIEMKPDLAPKHVERIKTLANEGFYDGIVFHRVIDGFMAQTGDPTGTGTGGSDMADLPAEFSDTDFGRGTIGMARTSDPNSANSQFFICFDDCSFLNGQYTIWGQVIEGMDFVDKIKRGEPPRNPDKMIKVTVGEAPNSSAEDSVADEE